MLNVLCKADINKLSMNEVFKINKRNIRVIIIHVVALILGLTLVNLFVHTSSVSFQHKLKGINTKARVIRRVHDQNTYLNRKEADLWKYKFYEKWSHRTSEYDMNSSMKKKLNKSYKYYKGLQEKDSIYSQLMKYISFKS